MIEAIKDAASIASSKFHSFAESRCRACPAYWERVDYWGEYDGGCTMHRDHLEFCGLSLLPKAIMKPYVKAKEKAEERYWERVYQEELAKDRAVEGGKAHE